MGKSTLETIPIPSICDSITAILESLPKHLPGNFRYFRKVDKNRVNRLFEVRGFMKRLLRLLFAAITILALSHLWCPMAMAADPFSDVPPDHWAYDAVRELTDKGYMDGYVDGTFKGRKVITRYELALILAKMLTKVESIEQYGGSVSDQDMGLFNKLSREFQDELTSLGIRLQQAEDRIKKLEDKAAEKPNLEITGYYRARQWWVQDPDTTYDDPYNYDDTDDADGSDRAGFSRLYHDVYLKFLGKPFDIVETYLELHAWMFGTHYNMEYYTDNRSDLGMDPVLFDLVNERGAEIGKSHLKMDHPWANLRTFQNEAITPMTDPFKLTTGKDWLYNPNSGIEVNGTIYDVSHFSAVYNTDTHSAPYFASNGPDYKQQDTFLSRWSYVMPQKFMKNSELILSGTYLEYINDYIKYGNYNKITGVDLSYKNNNYGRLSVLSEIINTEDGIDGDTILKDLGHKMDVSYSLDEYTYSLNYYNYGKDMRIRTNDVEGLYVDYEKWRNGKKYYNYGRKLGNTDDLLAAGETFVRFTGKYDYDNKGNERDFQAEAQVQIKDWEEVPGKPNETDGFRGQKYSLELWADITEKLRSRFKAQLHRDAFANETGTGRTELELNGTWKSRFKTKSELWLERDADAENMLGNSQTDYGLYSEISTDVTPTIWSKFSSKYEINRANFNSLNVDPANLGDDDDKRDNTEMQLTEYLFETNVNLTSSIALNTKLQSRFEKWQSYPNLDKDTYWIITEFKNDFSSKLKGKTVFWWKKIFNNDSSQGSIFENLYSELIYDATDKTKLKLIWGDWIGTSKDDRPSIGKPEIETEKKLLFEATTDF
jgi:hypothetical protein